MQTTGTKKINNKAILALIMLAAALFRLIALTRQSLWLDELHTMNISDPYAPWSELFRILKCCDQHPPLFFVLERLLFTCFGYTEWVARILPAIAGTLCCWAIYRLGKEILNERLGLIAAAFTCVNIFNLDHSQEARGYTLFWLFATLSYLFFIRVFKHLRKSDALYYVISTTLLVYTHYFSFMLLCCQAILCIIFLAGVDNNKRSRLLVLYIFSAAIICLLSLPLLSFVGGLTDTGSFWVTKPKPTFFIDFYYEYFANAIFVFSPVLLYYAWYAIRKFRLQGLAYDPLNLSLVFVFVSIFFAYLIPYVRSVLVVPMMVSRYTIIVIPSYILAIAYGFELIKNSKIRNALLTIALLISLSDIFFVKKYYSVRYTQFREMTEYMASGNKTLLCINDRCAWQQIYYRKKYKYTGNVLEGSKEKWVDTILAGCIKVDTFWIVGAHGDPQLAEEKRCDLDTAYSLVKEKYFHDAWAQLYARKPSGQY